MAHRGPELGPEGQRLAAEAAQQEAATALVKAKQTLIEVEPS